MIDFDQRLEEALKRRAAMQAPPQFTAAVTRLVMRETASKKEAGPFLARAAWLNDAAFVECAQALARRVAASPAPSRGQQLRDVFRRCLTREPSAAELGRLDRLFADALQVCRCDRHAAAKLIGGESPAGVDAAEAAAWVVLARAVMNLDEFVTRE